MVLPTLQRALVFFDLETTGTDLNRDRVVEIALIRVEADGSQHPYETRVDPQMDIPEAASAIHGIWDEDVRHAPTFGQIAAEVALQFKDADVAGYNVRRFDLPLLEMEFSRCSLPSPFPGARVVDSFELFQKLVSHSLEGALKFFCGRSHENAHAAMADVKATMDVLAGQLDKFPDLPRDVDALCLVAAPKDSDKFVDPLGKLIKNAEGEPAINFGRYKGKSLKEMVRVDEGYLRWMLSKDFHPLVVKHLKATLDDVVAIRAGVKR